jgi:hypothetical protein
MFTVPWAPDDRIERTRDAQLEPGSLNAGDPGIFNRPQNRFLDSEQ